MLYFCILLIVVSVNAAKFPSDWKKCPKTGNEECLKSAVEEAIKSLKNGNQKLGMLPLEPFHFEKSKLSASQNNPVAIDLTLLNGDLSGASTIRVDSIKVDWDKYNIEMDYSILGEASLISDYVVDGKVLVLPIKGNGKANFTFEDYKGKITMKGSELVKGDKKYINIEEATYAMTPRKAHIHLSNLFGGNKVLGDNMNTFLNENWNAIQPEISGVISKVFGEGIKQIANSFFHKIPIDQIFTS